jgi:four helix bundle protein
VGEPDRSERLDLRIRTKQFALRVIRLCAALPRGLATDVIGRQVLRSATSVGANFREAHRARSNAEFISKLGDCLRELDETSYWFELLVEGELIPASRLSALIDECNQLLAILTTISRKVKSYAR